MGLRIFCVLAGVLHGVPALGQDQIPVPKAALVGKLVNVDNFNTAETDTYMGKYVNAGALGKFAHVRSVTPLDGQDVIRMNRDTLYSMLVLDLSVDATVTIPNAGDRFVSTNIISGNHDVFTSVYEPGEYQIKSSGCGCSAPCRTEAASTWAESCSAIGTRYVFVLVRTLADGNNETDMAAAHAVQDGLRVKQEWPSKEGDAIGKWEPPAWDDESLKETRDLLLKLKFNSKAPTTFGFFTGPEKIDHLFGILNMAAGWGGVRAVDQTYVFWNPPADKLYTLNVGKVPVEGNGFYSITMYNDEGFMFATPSNYNSATEGAAGLNADGSTTVYFGGCDDESRQKPSKSHCLPTQKGWSMVVRIFRPSLSLLNGEWTFPDPQPSASGSLLDRREAMLERKAVLMEELSGVERKLVGR